MRKLLRSLVLLDLLSLVFLVMQLWNIAHHFTEIEKQSEKLSSALMFPMFILLIVGAFGLWFGKKFGFIIYYFQFPFRLYLWVFTLGFITLLPEAFGRYEDYWFDVLLKVCIASEFIRLYITIRAQMLFSPNKSTVLL